MADASGMQRQPQMQSGAVGPISRHVGVQKIGARRKFFWQGLEVWFDCAVGRGFPFDEKGRRGRCDMWKERVIPV